MWIEHCENPQPFEAMYSSFDGLERVRLFELGMGQEGRLQLRMELPRFPDSPPPRWSPEANAVQVVVDFWLIRDFRLENWRAENEGVLSLVPADGDFALTFESPEVRLTARCGGARIVRFCEYLDGGPEGE